MIATNRSTVTSITRSNAIVNLAELARQIDAEHDATEEAVRDGLAHASQAGALILQAKEKVPHGNWLSWLEANCKVTPRTAQRYMRLATHWDEVRALGGETLGLQGALGLLTQVEDASNTTRVSHLPAALAYFQEQGLIDDDSLQALLDLVDDYGPDIMTPLCFKKLEDEPNESNTFFYLNAIRPLDHPPLWPYGGKSSNVAAAAIKIFHEDGCSRGSMPQWEVTSYWFAATMIHLAGAVPSIKFGDVLRKNLSTWRESFRTALVVVSVFGRESFDKEGDDLLWLGYQSDLRHAGVVQAALEMSDDDEVHPGLQGSLMAGLDDIQRQGDYPLPSYRQR